jgi:arginine deiminase
MTNHFRASAFGGTGWSPRNTTLHQEIGQVWGRCGTNDEWSPLKAVLLHRPGSEVEQISDADAVQMLGTLRVRRAQEQHDALAQAYRDAGIALRYVEPPGEAPPNLMFLADLLFMTPEGAVLGRPASKVRAGEERLVAARLAELGIPILCSVRGGGTFEGADAAWIDPDTVLLATGLRTNRHGADQVAAYPLAPCT